MALPTRTAEAKASAVARGPSRPFRGVVAVYAAFVLLVLGLIELQPRANADVAVLAPPWSAPGRAARVVAAADGDVVSGTRWPFVIIAHPRSARFTAAAYARGAWFVFDAGLIAGCRPSGDVAAIY